MSIECYVEDWDKFEKVPVRMVNVSLADTALPYPSGASVVDMFQGLNNEDFQGDYRLFQDAEGYWCQYETKEPTSAAFLRRWLYSFEDFFDARVYDPENGGYHYSIPADMVVDFLAWINIDQKDARIV